MLTATNKETGDPRSNKATVSHSAGSQDRPEALGLVIGLIIACVLCIWCLCGLLPPAEAMQPGNITYFRNITPQNDVFELQVHPGDTLLQDRSYDLTHVYGITGTFAHWEIDANAGVDCNPDYVVNTSYIATNGAADPKNFYIDPNRMPPGDWYQWEGCYDAGPQKGENVPDIQPYIADDNLMFTVINYSGYALIQRWDLSRALIT